MRSAFAEPYSYSLRPSQETAREEREFEDNFKNGQEAFRLLDLIVAEFESDPMSVQCFDLRIVEAAKLCVAKRRRFVKNNPDCVG
jgi:hypothetical protein